jgi:hypothetical protein
VRKRAAPQVVFDRRHLVQHGGAVARAGPRPPHQVDTVPQEGQAPKKVQTEQNIKNTKKGEAEGRPTGTSAEQGC